MPNAYEKRKALRQEYDKKYQQQRKEYVQRAAQALIKQYQEAFRLNYGNTPSVVYSKYGRYCTGSRKYHEQEFRQLTQFLFAKYHEQELRNGYTD